MTSVRTYLAALSCNKREMKWRMTRWEIMQPTLSSCSTNFYRVKEHAVSRWKRTASVSVWWERGLRTPERLPAVADVPEPGLLPQAPAAVESDRGVVETPPGCLAELVHHGWLPCTGWLVSSLIQGICTDRRVSWFWARFLFVALWCPAGRRARTD